MKPTYSDVAAAVFRLQRALLNYSDNGQLRIGVPADVFARLVAEMAADYRLLPTFGFQRLTFGTVEVQAVVFP